MHYFVSKQASKQASKQVSKQASKQALEVKLVKFLKHKFVSQSIKSGISVFRSV